MLYLYNKVSVVKVMRLERYIISKILPGKKLNINRLNNDELQALLTNLKSERMCNLVLGGFFVKVNKMIKKQNKIFAFVNKMFVLLNKNTKNRNKRGGNNGNKH